MTLMVEKAIVIMTMLNIMMTTVDLGQVVILSDPFNCNTLAVKAAHHPHCPTERQGQRKHAKDNDKTLPGGVSDHHNVGDSKSSQARAELVAQNNCQDRHLNSCYSETNMERVNS